MMAGPPPRPHRGHTSPPEVPALPQGGGGGAGAEPSRGSLVSLYGAGQGFAQPSGHGRGDAAQTPLGVKGAPPARGTGCPRGAARSEPQFPVSHPAATTLPWHCLQNGPSLGRKSQCKAPGMWQLSPHPAGRSCKWARWSVQSPSDSSTPWPGLPAPAVQCSQRDLGLSLSPFTSNDVLKVRHYYFVKSRASCASNSAPSLT